MGNNQQRLPKQRVRKRLRQRRQLSLQFQDRWRQHSLSRRRFRARCTQPINDYCKYGAKCRFHHVGEPGSEAASKSFAEHQTSKDQGGEASKGAGKHAGKGKSKGDGKGKKGNSKDGKTSSAVPSAAAAAAASTVTITEVDGAKVMESWKGFCAFCAKALCCLCQPF